MGERFSENDTLAKLPEKKAALLAPRREKNQSLTENDKLEKTRLDEKRAKRRSQTDDASGNNALNHDKDSGVDLFPTVHGNKRYKALEAHSDTAAEYPGSNYSVPLPDRVHMAGLLQELNTDTEEQDPAQVHMAALVQEFDTETEEEEEEEVQEASLLADYWTAAADAENDVKRWKEEADILGKVEDRLEIEHGVVFNAEQAAIERFLAAKAALDEAKKVRIERHQEVLEAQAAMKNAKRIAEEAQKQEIEKAQNLVAAQMAMEKEKKRRMGKVREIEGKMEEIREKRKDIEKNLGASNANRRKVMNDVSIFAGVKDPV